jgi:hypothetical protein
LLFLMPFGSNILKILIHMHGFWARTWIFSCPVFPFSGLTVSSFCYLQFFPYPFDADGTFPSYTLMISRSLIHTYSNLFLFLRHLQVYGLMRISNS